jgi:hypothetical protein
VIPHVVVLRQILERLCHREVDDGVTVFHIPPLRKSVGARLIKLAFHELRLARRAIRVVLVMYGRLEL